MLSGLFIGDALHTRGGRSEDLLVADWDDLERNIASEVRVKQWYKLLELRGHVRVPMY